MLFPGWTCGVKNSNQIIIKPAFLKALSFDIAEYFTCVRLIFWAIKVYSELIYSISTSVYATISEY